MRKTGRKLLGVILAASMTVAAVFPMQGAMAAGTDKEVERVETGKSSEEKVMMETMEDVRLPGELQGYSAVYSFSSPLFCNSILWPLITTYTELISLSAS